MTVMDGWESKKLTDLAEYINGRAFKPEDWGTEGLPIIRIEQLKNPQAVTDYYAGKLPDANIIEDGDLIFSWSASLFLRIWKFGRAALNQHLFRVVEKEGVDKLFLKSFIDFYLPELTKASHGSTMQHITRKELEKFSAPFPVETIEQSQIATILSTLDRAIEQTEAIIAKQQRIKAGLMQDLLTKGIDEHGVIRSEATHQFKDSSLGRIPVEWEVESLGSVIEIIDPNPSHRYPPSSDVGVPIASTENFVGDNDFDLSWSDRVPVSVLEKQKQRCNYSPDDVIFARKGRLGFARPYGNEDKVFSHTVVVLKPRNGRVYPRFILWLVRFRQFFDEIDKRMNSNSGVPTLGVAFISAVPVLVPKPEEQTRIIALLDNAEVATQKEVFQLQKLQKTKTGLMHDLLTGKVRVKA